MLYVVKCSISFIFLRIIIIGFANLGSLGVGSAILGAFAPTRKRALTIIAPRALVAASMVSLMTASIAGRNTQIYSLYSYCFYL
jgi:nucleoside permease NupC